MTIPPSFHEVRFPTSISLGASGGPGFKTSVLTLASGFERRNIDWSLARAHYDVAHGLKTQAQLDELLKFYHARFGRAYGFRYKDWADFQAPFAGETPQIMFTTLGTGSGTFQIVKYYYSPDISHFYTRPLKKIVTGTVLVYDNGALTADYTVDVNTGLITLGATLRATTGRNISVACEFDVPVRFDTDQMKVSIEDIDNYSWGAIPLVEVRT